MGTPAPDAVKRLADRFDQDRRVFLSGGYKEEQLRLEFLNPFFTALGWIWTIPLTQFGIEIGKRTPFPRAILRDLFLVLVICAAFPRAVVAASEVVAEAAAPVQQPTAATDSLLRRVVTQQDSLLQQGRTAQAAQTATETRNNWRYFWSALAQSLATIATLVFTVTLVVAQLATRYGLRMARRTLRWQNLAKLAFFLLTTALSLAVLHLGPEGVIVGQVHVGAVPLNWGVSGMAMLCGVILILHLHGLKRELNIDMALADVQKETLAAIGAGDARKTQDNVVAIEGAAHGASVQLDDSTLMAAVRCLWRIASAAEARAGTIGEPERLGDEISLYSVPEVRARIGRLPFSMVQNQQSVMSVVEAAASTMHEYRGDVLSANVRYLMDLVEDSAGMLTWPRDETRLIGYFDILRRHVVTGIRTGLDGGAAKASAEAVAERAERILRDAYKRGAGNVGKGAAWLGLVKMCSDGALLSVFPDEPQGEAADAYVRAGARLLGSPALPATHGDVAHEGFMLTCRAAERAAGFLADDASRVPRTPLHRSVQKEEADLLLSFLWRLVEVQKLKLRAAVLESLWQRTDGAAPSLDVKLGVLADAIRDRRLPALLESDTGNYNFVTALKSAVGPCHNIPEQAARAADILVCIGKAARGRDLVFRDRLFHIADGLLKSPAVQRVPGVVYCWFVLGAFWCEAPEGDQNLNRLDAVRREVSGFLQPSLNSDYHQVVRPRVDTELHDLLPALHTFANRAVQ
jgi:hypothetical protein